MELTRKDFEQCKSISIDNSYVQPKIRMCTDMNGKIPIHTIDCNDDESAEELFSQLLDKWQEVKNEIATVSAGDT